MKQLQKMISAILILGAGSLFAQSPTWNVNPSAFQYNMTVTASLDVNCAELTNPSNKLGAFVGGVLRGTANTSNVINGKYITTMSVYSNAVSGETVNFQFYDVASDSIYMSVDSILFQDNAIYGTLASPFIVKTNNAPTSLSISNDSIQENIATGQVVGTLSTVDADQGQSHTYTLVSGVGSTNNNSFSIVNGQLIANFVADFENKNSYTVRLRATDSEGCFLERQLTIIVKNTNDAPSAITLSNAAIDEQMPANSVIGLLTATDQDANEVFTYSLVSGAGSADNSKFNVFGNSLRANQVFNFETQSTFTIRVRVTDRAANTFEDSLLIIVNDLNDVPTDLLLSKDSVQENRAQNFLVGTLSTVDEDAAQTHAYSFDNIPGNDNANFLIVGDQLRTSTVFDYEGRKEYFVYVQTNDLSGGLYTKLLTIRIIDANDVPTDLLLSNASANENMPAGLFVGKLNTLDQDTFQIHTYSLANGVGDADNADFTVRNDSLFTAIMLDKNLKPQHSIRIATDDQNGGVFSKAYTIFVKDVNNLPSSISLSNAIFPENTPIGGQVGVLSTVDADLGDVHTYSLVAGAGSTDNSSFQIAGDRLQTRVAFNFNQQQDFTIRIETNDGFGGTFQDTFNISVTNSNDAPTDIMLSPASFNEMVSQNTTIGLLSSSDADSTDTHSYSFVQGTNDNSSFVISGDQLRTQGQFDFETKQLYIIEVKTTDALGLSYTRQLTVNVLDSNDAPTALALSNDSIDEQQPVGTFVANLSTTDADAADSFTYSLVAGQGASDNGLFRINGQFLETDSVLNYNNQRKRNVRIRSTDTGGKFTEKDFVINVVNKNDNPTALLISDTTIIENSAVGTRIASFTSIDADNAETFTYTLVNGLGDADNGKFSIQNDELFSASTFDFETKSSYSIRVRTTDSRGGIFDESFSISVLNDNERPTSSEQSFSVEENLPLGSFVGQVIVDDIDNGDVLTYQLISGTAQVSVDPSSGELSTASSFDYESVRSYDILLQTSDAGGLKDTTMITIEVLDKIEGTLPAAGYFSPNGDGYNDTWEIQNVSLYSDYKLVIFATTGEIIFDKSANYTNDWDGTYNGEQLPDGVYYYFLQSNSNSSDIYKGTITLKR